MKLKMEAFKSNELSKEQIRFIIGGLTDGGVIGGSKLPLEEGEEEPPSGTDPRATSTVSTIVNTPSIKTLTETARS